MSSSENSMDPFGAKRIYDSMERRRYVLATEEMTGMSEEDRMLRISALVDEQLFIIRRGTDYAFYRYINRRLDEVGWVRGHVHELGFLVLLDLLHPEVATIKDAENISQSNRLDRREDPKLWMYDVRHRRRLMNEYPELFFEPSPEDASRDGRRKPIRTVFKDIDLSGYQSPLLDRIVSMEQAAIANTFGSFENGVGYYHQMVEVTARLRFADPDDMKGLMDFERRMGEYLDLIIRELGRSNERFDWLVHAIRHRTRYAESLYHFINEAVVLRWFRERSAKAREKMIRHNYELVFTPEDARVAVSSNLAWFGIKVAEFQIWTAADMYDRIGRSDIGVLLLEELLAQIENDFSYESGRAVTHHNLGVQYRDDARRSSRYLLALDQFEQAKRIWAGLERPLDVGRTEAFIAECHHLLGREEECNRCLEGALQKVMASEERTEKLKGLVNIVKISRECRREDLATKAMGHGIEAADELGSTEYLLYFSGMLLNQSNRFGEMPPFDVKAPSELMLLRPTPTSFVPLLVSEEGSKTSERIDIDGIDIV